MNKQINQENGQYPVPVNGARLPAAEQIEPSTDEREESALKYYLGILSHRKKTIWVSMAIVLALALVVTLIMPMKYVGTADVEVTPSPQNVTNFQAVNNPAVGSNGPDDFTRTQIAIFQSNELARRVINKLHLDKNPNFNPFLDSGKKGIVPAMQKFARKAKFALYDLVYGKVPPDLTHQEQMETMVYLLESNLNVSGQLGTYVINVSYSSSNRNLARDVTNALVTEFIDWQMDRNVAASKIANKQLDRQIANARVKLDDSQAKMNAFADSTGIVALPGATGVTGLDARANAVYEQLEQINAALAKAEADRITMEETYNQAKTSDVSTLPSVIQNNLISTLRNQYIGLLAEYRQMSVNFQDDYPAVKSLKAKMIDVGQKIQAEENRILDSYKVQYLTALKTEQALQTTAADKKTQALKLNQLASQYKVMHDRVDSDKQIYQSLLLRSKEIEANVAADIGHIKIVDLSPLPILPNSPKIIVNFLVALILGLLVGTGAAFLREQFDSSVKRAEDISDRYSIPVLGVVPLVAKAETGKIESLVLLDRASAFSEAIRFSKASIDLSRSSDNPIKSILITSTSKGEGKSVIAANLAQAFAASEERVLLVDADLRKPRLNRIFDGGGNGNGNGHGTRGLSHYLGGESKIEEIIQKTDVPFLYFISAGHAPFNSTELLGSARMKSFMEFVSDNFDRIILDGPPFGSDVLVLGNKVDGTILIATLGKTPRESLPLLRRSLRRVNGHLLGTVVNKFSMNRFSGEYYRHYYQGGFDTPAPTVNNSARGESRDARA
jgi:succinoglycan biosynthesis transport protein ExoP